MFVVGDENKDYDLFPWVTIGLLAVNIFVFCVQEATHNVRSSGFALVPEKITTGTDLVGLRQTNIKYVNPELAKKRGPKTPVFVTESITTTQKAGPYPIYLTLITSMFMHGSLLHLLGNMWMLAIFGRSVEFALKPYRFLLYYLICGVAGGVAHTIADPHSLIPCIGASAAISGVMGAYLAIHPMRMLTVWLIFGVIQVPAIIVLGLWIWEQHASAGLAMEYGLNVGTGYMAHVGGFLAGLVLLWGTILYANFREGFAARSHDPDFDPLAGIKIRNELPDLASARFITQDDEANNRHLARRRRGRRWAIAIVLGGAATAFAVVGVAMAVPSLAALLRFPARHLEITRFASVRVGMTHQEVEATIGVPPGDYSGGGEPTMMFTKAVAHKSWIGPQQGLTVFFDDAGRVSSIQSYAVMPR